MMKTNAGFTLIELMMTVAVAAIVLTLAIPSFEATMRNNRLTTQTNDLVTSINLARAEAVKRRANVTMCASTNQSSCTASSWQQGWIVRDNTTGTVIRAFGPMKGTTTVNSGGVAQLQYSQRGFLQSGNPASLVVCAGSGSKGRLIEITATGRPAVNPEHPDC